MDFGRVPQGATQTRTIAIGNPDTKPHTIVSAAFELPDFTISNIDNTVIPAGGSIRPTVTFHATTRGAQTAKLTILFENGPGTGDPTATANVVDPTFTVATEDANPLDGRLDFGVVAAQLDRIVERKVIVTNADPFFPLSVRRCDGPNAPLLFVTCLSEVPPESTREVIIGIHPSNARGSRVVGTGGIVLREFDAPTVEIGSLNFMIEAQLTQQPIASAVERVEFGEAPLGSSSTRVVTITSLVDHAMTLSHSAPGFAFAPVGPETFSLPARGSVDVAVEFEPTEAGVNTGEWKLLLDEQRFVLLAIPLSGTGIARPPGDDPAPDDDDDNGDGDGGGCSTSRASTPAFALVALALVAIRRRRRR